MKGIGLKSNLNLKTAFGTDVQEIRKIISNLDIFTACLQKHYNYKVQTKTTGYINSGLVKMEKFAGTMCLAGTRC